MPVNPTWANHPEIASYSWSASRNGITFAVQYPPDAEETPLRKVFTPEPREDHTVWVVPAGESLRVDAIPERDGLPPAGYEYDSGDKMIWQHRVLNTSLTVFEGAPEQKIHFETLIFGKETANGDVHITQLYPDGSRIEHKSLAEAMSVN
jgi:hypothetical protein